MKALAKFAGFQAIYDFAKKLYLSTFLQQHWSIKPLRLEEIKEKCKEKNINFSEYQFNPSSKLCTNACLSKECPFFLEICDLRKHLGGWKNKIPRGFHNQIQQQHKLGLNELYEFAQKKWKGFPNAYDVTEETAKKYLQDLKESYTELEK